MSQKTNNDEFNDFKLDKEGLQPEMPRFDSYFESKSQDVHPFEHIKNSFDDSEMYSQEEIAYEKDREAKLHKKELIGRLYGRKITPRQFELLMGMDQTGSIKIEKTLDFQKNNFLTKEDYVRLTQEKYEKLMRQKVASGEWPESEKLQRLQKQIEDDVAKTPTKSELRMKIKEMEESA